MAGSCKTTTFAPKFIRRSLCLSATFSVFLCSFTILSTAARGATTHHAKHRHLLHYLNEFSDRGESVFVDPSISFENPCLHNAYVALQALKKAILSDPNKFITNWAGSSIFDYSYIFCSPAPDDPNVLIVSDIDLSHGDVFGYLPEELGLLADLPLFHLNSNRFYTSMPQKFEAALQAGSETTKELWSLKFALVYRVVHLHWQQIE